MIDFRPYREKRVTLMDLAAGLGRSDLKALTEEMVAAELARLDGLEDSDLVFEPDDPGADDPYSEDPAEATLAWTLGHVVVHATASSEEAAAQALTLARGVPVLGRSRHEVPWRQATTVEFCRARLRESLRMRLAMLDAWPDEPHLDNTYQAREGAPANNAVARFLGGLSHDDSHLEQMAKIAAQASAARIRSR